MPQFNVSSVASGDAITAGKINEIISRAKYCINRLGADNFANNTIPLAALKTPNSFYYVNIAEHGNIAGLVTLTSRTAVTGYLPLPASLSIVSAAVTIGSFTAGTYNAVVQVTRAGANPSALATATIASTAAKTYKAMTVNVTAIAAGQLLELRYSVPATETIYNIVVVLKCKATLST